LKSYCFFGDKSKKCGSQLFTGTHNSKAKGKVIQISSGSEIMLLQFRDFFILVGVVFIVLCTLLFQPTFNLNMHNSDLQAEAFLDRVKVKEICKSHSIVTLDAKDPIGKAMEILAQRGITGAPVWDAESKKFIGFVDTLDLTMFISYLYYENFQRHPHLYDPKELSRRFALPVQDVINASKRDPFWTVDAGETVGFLINNFLKAGIHRVPVVENGNVIGIVSQSDVVKLLAKNHPNIASLANKKLYQLGLDKHPVVTVKNDDSLIDAFNTILRNDISGLAVVDFQNGRLLNNLSASDLKGITETNFFRLEAQLHQVFNATPNKKPPVACSRFNTLGEVIGQLEKTGVHRVYVVDEELKPVGVISLTDIMRCFSRPFMCDRDY